MPSMNKIVLLICYYGEFPWYFPYFLHSCKYNPSVTFMIITDATYNYDLPENVIFVKKSLDEIKILASEKLGLSFQIDFPYKLCDLRPAYGFVFTDFIKGYDFWGYCDIDVIFGKIRNFMTSEVLDHCDVISPRHDYLLGAFTLFRNTQKINELYKQSKDYKKVFTSPKHYCFDETNFAFKPFAEGLPPEEIQSEIESMTHVVKRLDNEHYIRAYFDFHIIEGYPGRLTWQKGVLTYKKRFEVMLYHMVRFKKNCKQTRIKKIPDTFHISPARIYA